MANRMSLPLKGSLTPGITCLTGNWLFGDGAGGVGDVTVSAAGFGVGAMVDALQTITLEDRYNELLGVEFTHVEAAAWESLEYVLHANLIELTAEDVNGDRTISLRYLRNRGGDADPSEYKMEGIRVHCMIWLKNSGL